MGERQALAPAFYAAGATGWRRDVWALLHPPYTAWHLSYVLVGAGLAVHVDLARLLATLLAFFFAVGVSAHVLDELHGRPLGTTLPAAALWPAAVAGLAVAVGLGLAGVSVVGPPLLAFIAAGVLFVFAYNLELGGGRLHGDFWFALSWGAFPVLTSFYAQTGRISIAAVLAAGAAFALSWGQRALSTPARLLRRRATGASGSVSLAGGAAIPLDRAVLLRPLERALRAFSWAAVAIGIAMVASRALA